ncbi:TIGR02444 family protein [Pseudomonas benzenivorans]|uniref:TIGR02444 family protein n=1 Tax=Pseudomonas benzenivorans TaxID=556533 RepID=A0ABY5HEH2_9PSED|nr:TIGR02444 family protein [Pseudomonas benzenivorans]UTW09737.1 TIGR02444 family protein [Pseudomonas benzenivorans]
MPTDLWRFAEHYYQRPGVEAACLQLQASGADVCLLICGVWLGRRGVACSAVRIEQLKAIAQPWQHQVVERLRQLRQDWRGAAQGDETLAALREQVKRLELEAEREQLHRLAILSQAWPIGAAQDLQSWLEAFSPTTTEADRDALQQLRVAALQP